jgi:hypothetical protein
MWFRMQGDKVEIKKEKEPKRKTDCQLGHVSVNCFARKQVQSQTGTNKIGIKKQMMILNGV